MDKAPPRAAYYTSNGVLSLATLEPRRAILRSSRRMTLYWRIEVIHAG